MKDPFKFETDLYIEEIKKKYPPRIAKKIIRKYKTAIRHGNAISEVLTKEDIRNIKSS